MIKRDTPKRENGWLPFITSLTRKRGHKPQKALIDGRGRSGGGTLAGKYPRHRRRKVTDRPRLTIYHPRQQTCLSTATSPIHPVSTWSLRYAHDVDINGTRIFRRGMPNTDDATDPTDSQNIRITKNYIDCNDDHIAIIAEKVDPRFPDGVVDNIYRQHHPEAGRGSPSAARARAA